MKSVEDLIAASSRENSSYFPLNQQENFNKVLRSSDERWMLAEGGVESCEWTRKDEKILVVEYAYAVAFISSLEIKCSRSIN